MLQTDQAGGGPPRGMRKSASMDIGICLHELPALNEQQLMDALLRHAAWKSQLFEGTEAAHHQAKRDTENRI